MPDHPPHRGWPYSSTLSVSRRESEKRRRVVESIGACLTVSLLVLLSRVETHVYSLSAAISEKKQFLTTIAHFALINVNVILILILSLLIFRNLARLVMARRQGVVGSRLRSKLVVALLFFAIMPSLLLSYVSYRFITRSFDHWFANRVSESISTARDIWSAAYRSDQARLMSLARIAAARVEMRSVGYGSGVLEEIWHTDRLVGFARYHNIDDLRLYDSFGHEVAALRGGNLRYGAANSLVQRHLEQMRRFPFPSELGWAVAGDAQDVVFGAAAIVDQRTGELGGVVVAELQVQTQVLQTLEKVLDDFSTLRASGEFVRSSYMIMMAVILLLIVFSATWLGLSVAQSITRPLQELAGGIRALAGGHYDITIDHASQDEAGQLAVAFNQMVRDLQAHEQQQEQAKKRMQHANDELRRRKQYMEVVLAHVSSGIIALDHTGCVTSMNETATRLLRIHANRAMGRPLASALSAKVRQVFWDPIEAALRHRHSIRLQIEMHPDGLDAAMIVQATRLVSEAGAQMGVVIVFHDAEEQLQAQKVLAWREVARRIAHEVKNPITPIKLNAQRLRRRFAQGFTGTDLEVFTGCLYTIEKQVDALGELVRGFSRGSPFEPNQGRARAVLVPLCEELLRLYRECYPGVSFSFESPPHLLPVAVDVGKMRQVLVNLLDNAVQACAQHPQRRVTLILANGNDCVSLRVLDTGPGVPEACAQRVFEPYYTTKAEGSGLGLAIVAQIVGEFGGEIRLRQASQGADMEITLPVRSGGDEHG